jgi:Domain of unknown function (DUF3387)
LRAPITDAIEAHFGRKPAQLSADAGYCSDANLVIKSNVSIDWMHRTSARANIRRHVKRLLRKYGYPPDLQDAAVQNVLQQAEALSAEWA